MKKCSIKAKDEKKAGLYKQWAEEKDGPGALEGRKWKDGGGNEMPWMGEKGDGWKRRVPGLQMVYQRCHGYDWCSLYCTARTVRHTTL